MRIGAALLVFCAAGLAAEEKSVLADVLSVDRTAKTAQVRSPESTAERQVILGEADVAIGWTGRRIRYVPVRQGDKVRADRIFPADPEELRRMKETTDVLRRATADRGRMVTRMPTELVPDMALWSQDAKLVTKRDLLGRPFVLNFVFTSCRNAKMCPAATRCMKQLGDVLDKSGSEVRLVTITFDPEVDSPGTLRAYADGYGIDGRRHLFLTGDEGQIRDLMRQYGILTAESDGTIVHNAATLVVSAEGRIVRRFEGATFDPEQILQSLSSLRSAR
jgi:cytochrome oxidase Cu insertion factor (SCO1/SenC/PrrC family)